MAEAPTKRPVPLQAVVGVICDALADLETEDQARALNAVRTTLGVTGTRRVEVSTRAPTRSESMALVAEFFQSMHPTQLDALIPALDVSQKIMLMEILALVDPARRK